MTQYDTVAGRFPFAVGCCGVIEKSEIRNQTSSLPSLTLRTSCLGREKRIRSGREGGSNQRIISQINLMKFLSGSQVSHNFCLFKNEFTAFRRFFSGLWPFRGQLQTRSRPGQQADQTRFLTGFDRVWPGLPGFDRVSFNDHISGDCSAALLAFRNDLQQIARAWTCI